MSTTEIQSLESFLMPYAQERFNIGGSGILGNFAKSITGGKLSELATRLVQAYVRGLFNVFGEIYLRDFASAVISEAAYMMGIKPVFTTVSTTVRAEQFFTGDHFYHYQTEIHHWFIYLAENRKLPGKYERFIGKFSRS